MIEVLKRGKSVKFIRIRGPREARPPGIRQKNLPGGAGFDSFRKFPGGGPGVVTLGID